MTIYIFFSLIMKTEEGGFHLILSFKVRSGGSGPSAQGLADHIRTN